MIDGQWIKVKLTAKMSKFSVAVKDSTDISQSESSSSSDTDTDESSSSNDILISCFENKQIN